MPVDLGRLAAPAHTALITSETQRGVVGDLSRLPDLADAARNSGALDRMGALAAAARRAGVNVVHGTANRRADGRGANHNARLFGAMNKLAPMLPGSDDEAVVPEIGCADGDLVLARMHGLSPMAGTSLDAVLRNLGVTTVVIIGVSVNVAVTNLTFDAVNLGYDVVLPRDAVVGFPADYVDAVFANTLSLCATVTTTDALLDVWTA